MVSVFDIYERKDYQNSIPLAHSVSFEIEVRETRLVIQARNDLTAKAKDSVFRYRYQIEEYLRQHPAFRETESPIQVYASAPEIVRYCDVASRRTGVPPMSCMGGAIADFVGRDLIPDSPNIIVSSGGDSFVKTGVSLDAVLYAKGSPLHEKLCLALPAFQKPLGISTFVPKTKGIHAVTVLSRSACLASAFSRDIGDRLSAGEGLASVLKRAEAYIDVGCIVMVAGTSIVLGGDMVLRSLNGHGSLAESENN